MEKVNKIERQREVIEVKVEELMELLKKFEGSKSDAAQYICTEAALWGGCNHYEMLGILEESLLDLRERSLKALKEEE